MATNSPEATDNAAPSRAVHRETWISCTRLLLALLLLGLGLVADARPSEPEAEPDTSEHHRTQGSQELGTGDSVASVGTDVVHEWQHPDPELHARLHTGTARQAGPFADLGATEGTELTIPSHAAHQTAQDPCTLCTQPHSSRRWIRDLPLDLDDR